MNSAPPFASPLVAPLALASVFMTAGCGLFQQAPPKAATIEAAPVVAAARPGQASASAPVRHVGDLFVHRFSGSFA